METTSALTPASFLRDNLRVINSNAFNKVISSFPTDTISAICDRVSKGSEREVHLYSDVLNINGFKYEDNGTPEDISLRYLNAVTLTSDLIDDVPYMGWDADRATLTDALSSLPKEAVQRSEMNAHRLRSAVLVNIVVDRSDSRDDYNEIVDFFEKNFDAVYSSLPALMERHKDMGKVDLDLVEDIIGGIPLSIVEGTL